jgi:hypothetical protein
LEEENNFRVERATIRQGLIIALPFIYLLVLLHPLGCDHLDMNQSMGENVGKLICLKNGLDCDTALFICFMVTGYIFPVDFQKPALNRKEGCQSRVVKWERGVTVF